MSGSLTGFDAARAARWLDERKPSPEVERLVRYWLSLWRGDELPRRADFHPRAVAELLPTICIFDVVPDESVSARLIGSRLVEGAGGVDITGRDWLDMTAPADRSARLERFSKVARGAIGFGLREARRTSGAVELAEEIMLPFGGAAQVLTYIAWTPSLYDPVLTGISKNSGLLTAFELVPLADGASAR